MMITFRLFLSFLQIPTPLQRSTFVLDGRVLLHGDKQQKRCFRLYGKKYTPTAIYNVSFSFSNDLVCIPFISNRCRHIFAYVTLIALLRKRKKKLWGGKKMREKEKNFSFISQSYKKKRTFQQIKKKIEEDKCPDLTILQFF